MATIQAYSSISIFNLTNVGQINFYLTSNLPNNVVYNPNNRNYSPDWSDTNLVITPVVTYNGRTLPLGSNGLTVTYSKILGNVVSQLTNKEVVSNGLLTVSSNILSSVNTQLTYKCTVTYVDPDANVPLSTEASLTYVLISMATEIKKANIIGETNFVYNTDRILVGSDMITLTASVSNCIINNWQYKNDNGTFTNFPLTNNSSISNTTLIVKADEQDIWINDGKTAVIKLTTDDPNIYDYIQINKLYDGAAGTKTVSAVLTNENHTLPVDSEGVVKTWNGSTTQIFIYEGGTDVTDRWTISTNSGNGLQGTYDATTHVFTPSGITVDSSYVDFVCTKTGSDPIIKRYTITRQTIGNDGADAVIYEVIPDFYTIGLDEDGVFTPSYITFYGYKKVGEQNRSAYRDAQFAFYESTDGENYTFKERSQTNEAHKRYFPSSSSVVTMKCIMYSESTNTELDSQSVVVTKDGKNGIFMGLGNDFDGIPCSDSGTAAEALDIEIPFYAYKGDKRVPVTAYINVVDLPSGVTVKSNISGTASAGGMVTLRVAQGADFGDPALLSGIIDITLTVGSNINSYKFTWNKNIKALNGENAVLLQLYSEDGGTVEIGRDTTIKLLMHSGSVQVFPSQVEWQKWDRGDYRTISGQTGTSITITEAMVTDQLWLKCNATYEGTTYSAYFNVDDITDPITSYTYATIKEFKNGNGFGAIYTRLYRGTTKEEVDPIKSTTFSDTPPSVAVSGDYYYHLDPTGQGSCVLKKYNGYDWVVAEDSSDQDLYTYEYYRIDETGDPIDEENPWKTGRCQFVSASLIGERMQFICEVYEDE